MNIKWKDMGVAEIAGAVESHLRENGVDAVLVGGACVTIYSENKYVSSDLDLVTDASIRKVEKILAGIGFKKIEGRLFGRKDCDYILDFVAPPLAIGNEPVNLLSTIKTRQGEFKLLTPSDCVKDRLSAYYHWNDFQSFDQAVMVAKAQKTKINLDEIAEWSKKENNTDKFNKFRKEV